MDITVRQATKEDISMIAEIHVAGWQGAYGGIVDQSYLDDFTVEKRIEKWTEIFDDNQSSALIASIDDQAVGFLDYGPLRTAPAGTSKIRPLYSSEIYALYLKPDYFRRGVGTALMREAVGYLKSEKHHSTCLWVLDANKRAKGFYEAMNGQRIGKKMVEIGPNRLKEVCYGWRDISDITAL